MTQRADHGTRTTRRQFLAVAGIATAGATACSSKATSTGSTSTSQAPVQVTPPSYAGTVNPFTLGVASGDPDASSFILWTRLAPTPQAADGFGGLTAAAQNVLCEVASDAKFDHIVTSHVVAANREHGYSVHAEIGDLPADTWYHYRFRVGDHVSPHGKARTTPARTATPDRLRIAFASCQERQAGHWAAYRAMATDELDLVFHLGDYIYEYGGGEGPLWAPGTKDGTLAQFRNQYAAYKADKNLQAAHALCPWVVTWDDHEVENNYADESSADATESTAAFAARRAAAYQAYWENMPLRVAPPKDGAMRLYREQNYGTLAAFHVVDGRQYRTDQVCNDKVFIPDASCPERNDASNSMLGSEQMQWLEKGLETNAVWQVLANQTVMSPLVLSGFVLNLDQWDGYTADRERLYTAVKAAGVKNFVVLTGDIHSAGATSLYTGASTPAQKPTQSPIGVEFVGTSISSEGLVGVIPNGDKIVTAEALGLSYLNVKDHGYCRCTVTPTDWVTEFVMVADRKSDTAAARVDARLSVAVDSNTITRLA